MGASLRVYSPVLVEFIAADFLAEIKRVVKTLLYQAENFKLDLVLLNKLGTEEAAIAADGSLHTLVERSILGEGIQFYYEIDKYWSLHSDVPLFEFAIVEIPRRDDDICLVLCLAIAIAAAHAFSVSHIADGNGVWSLNSESDLIELQELFDFANDRTLPLEDALQTFYRKLPAFR